MAGMSLVQALAMRVYRSKLVAQALFGIEFPPLGPKDYYFDISTHVVVREVGKRIGPQNHLLDLGTGSFAVIGLSLWKKTGCRVTCADLNPELAASSRRNVALNNAPIEVVDSDLFTNVTVPFDVVTFNPPYITTAAGQDLGIESRPAQWDGGEDGLRAVRPFLEAVAARGNPVTAYLAMNTLFVKGDAVRALVAKEPGLEYLETIRSRLLPIELHVLRNRR
ncbi:MAG: methyltransferase [Planctomycetes bacterium]|nr:methyltransferase [Planctomycetota bacterium]